MSPLELVKLTALMGRTSGGPLIRIGLVDGPVAIGLQDFAGERIKELPGPNGTSCANADSLSCLHGTFVAGILAGKRGSRAPAICPGCTFLVRPIFSERVSGHEQTPSATPEVLAEAINDCIAAGARLINLSLGLARPSTLEERNLQAALDRAAKQGVIVVAAAGNQGTLGSTAITRHPWVIPVAACDAHGRPLNESNLGSSIGRRGLSAPGGDIASFGADGKVLSLSGTSVAVPFVTGAIALLWSEFPSASAARIKLAILQSSAPRRASVVPPLLDVAAAHRVMLAQTEMRQSA
jgi:subtilisin family serine protease